MNVLRTPDDCFTNLPDYDFAPHYHEFEDPDLGTLRLHYLDEGPADGPVVLCMHGEPSWCYLYRKMIPVFVAAGMRVLAPDLIGFGRSDKPAERTDYTYQRHVDWMTGWLKAMDVSGATIMPGLVDVHAHPRTGAEIVPDEGHLLNSLSDGGLIDVLEELRSLRRRAGRNDA